jgi:adenylate cyclase
VRPDGSQFEKELSQNIKNGFPDFVRIGTDAHVGDVGYAGARSVSAIGDPVNTANRLETMNKEHTSQLIFSEKVTAHAGIDLSAQRSESVAVRSRAEPLRVYILNDAADIKGLVEA